MSASEGLVVAVCTANICRSPMVEALLAHAMKAQPAPLQAWRVVSAGVCALSGDSVSTNSVTALKKVGLNISAHRSQPLTPEMVEQADVILVMTESHRAAISLMFDPSPENIYLLREFMPAAASREIVDPYGSALPAYEACRDEIVEAVPSVIAFLRQLADAK
jgi:protein-tyrosine phosphatase